MVTEDLRILYLSSIVPKECGIATFTQDLMDAVKLVDPKTAKKIDTDLIQCAVAVNERGLMTREYPAYVKYELEQESLKSYSDTALYINESDANVLCLQHEFGLFGGFDGIFILKLLAKVKIPVVTFFHTIPILKDAKRRNYRLKILKSIGELSKFIIVTANIGKNSLIKEGNLPVDKFVIIRHGAPDVPFTSYKEREALKRKFNLEGRFLILTYGLISQNKGLGLGVDAISKLVKRYPNVLYLILGVTHPVRKRRGEDTEKDLETQVAKLKLNNNVLFINRYLKEEELNQYLSMTDVFLTPYLTKTQISSGVLARAMASGDCVVSTPFVYAKELLREGRGYFIDFESSDSIARVVSDLIENPKKIEEAREKAYEFSRQFTWPEVGKKVVKVFQKAIEK